MDGKYVVLLVIVFNACTPRVKDNHYLINEKHVRDSIYVELEENHFSPTLVDSIVQEADLNYFGVDLLEAQPGAEYFNHLKANDPLRLFRPGKAYSFLLYMMDEPNLSELSEEAEIYRLTMLQPFHKPLSIRIDKRDGKLTVKIHEGGNGRFIGRQDTTYIKNIDNTIWVNIDSIITECGYWSMPTQYDHDEGVFDAESIILECISKDKYHVVERYAASSLKELNTFWQACRSIIDLAEVDQDTMLYNYYELDERNAL